MSKPRCRVRGRVKALMPRAALPGRGQPSSRGGILHAFDQVRETGEEATIRLSPPGRQRRRIYRWMLVWILFVIVLPHNRIGSKIHREIRQLLAPILASILAQNWRQFWRKIGAKLASILAQKWHKIGVGFGAKLAQNWRHVFRSFLKRFLICVDFLSCTHDTS